MTLVSNTPVMSAALATPTLPNFTPKFAEHASILSTATTITMSAVEDVFNCPELVDLILGKCDRWYDKYRVGCATEVARARFRAAFNLAVLRDPLFVWRDFDRFAGVQQWLVSQQQQVRQPSCILHTPYCLVISWPLELEQPVQPSIHRFLARCLRRDNSKPPAHLIGSRRKTSSLRCTSRRT